MLRFRELLNGCRSVPRNLRLLEMLANVQSCLEAKPMTEIACVAIGKVDTLLDERVHGCATAMTAEHRTGLFIWLSMMESKSAKCR